MTQKDIKRIQIIEKYNNKEISSQQEASNILWISTRHFRRLLKRYNKHWTKWIIHKARWKPSNRKLSLWLIERIKQIISKPEYHDFWPTLLNETLKEIHNINISTEKLRQIMIQEWYWKSKERKKTKQFINRPRKEYHTRKVKNEYTIQFENKYIQLYKNNLNLYPWLEVEIQQQFNDNIRILLNGKVVEHKILEAKRYPS